MTDPIDVASDGACCEACAVRPPAIRSLQVVDVVPQRVPISRDTDRRITVAGVGLAAGFVALALLGLAHLVVGRTGPWVPVHLALAGAASTAIAAVMPFFTAALAAARPADPRLRAAAIGAVATGALVVSITVPIGATVPAVAGGLAFVAGIAAVAAAAIHPMGSAVGVRRLLIERAYVLALTQVAVGALLAIGMVSGFAPIVERWAWLKPAHAWLNVFGFLGVVIAATLIHLGPTVAGSRIRPRRSATIAVAGLVVGAPSVAIGMTLGSDPIVRLGAIAASVGAVSLVAHAIAVHRDGAHWSADRAWHRLTRWALLGSTGWFLAAVLIVASRHVWLGADPTAWSVGLIAAPLVIGSVGQALVGSWSHLVPAIGPGGPADHARQRELLGRGATLRLAASNGGIALVMLGTVAGTAVGDLGAVLTTSGLVVAVASLGVSLVLLARAILVARPTRTLVLAS